MKTQWPGGAMLADPVYLGNEAGGIRPAVDPTAAAPSAAGEALARQIFEPAYWAARGELRPVTAGRGSAWFIVSPRAQWALRHYRRGGFMARLSQDRYVWAGEKRVRSFAEFRLLQALSLRGLPVPRAVAARYQRLGPFYRCDLLTERIPDTAPLSAVMAAAAPDDDTWRSIGAVIGRLHAAGVDHADLNAHNILIDAAGVVSVIDFDRGRLRSPGGWAARNLERLHRSLLKVQRGLPAGRFSDARWAQLLIGYSGA